MAFYSKKAEKKTPHLQVGEIGERQAAGYLRRHLYRIVSCNCQMGRYEVDIVAKTLTTLVFCEVKTRTAPPPAELADNGSSTREDTATPFRRFRPADAVDKEKRRHISLAARQYLTYHPTKKRIRFDVIEVWLSPADASKVLAINHIKNAFLPQF